MAASRWNHRYTILKGKKAFKTNTVCIQYIKKGNEVIILNYERIFESNEL